MAVPEIKIKLDLHGSTQRIGVSSHRHARATRLFRAKGALNNDQILNKVLVEAIRQAGPFYHAPTVPGIHGPNDPLALMPLRAASAKRFGALVTGKLFYGFDRWSPRGDPEATAEIHGKYEPTESFRYPYIVATNEPAFSDITGLPDGPVFDESVILTDRFGGRPRAKWTFNRPAASIFVSTVLSFNPIRDVFPLMGHVNSDQVTFAGFPFDATTVRFDKPIVTWSSTRFGDRFAVTYVFTVVAGGHWKHFPYWDQKAARWDIREAVAYEQEQFAGAFPV